VKKIIFTKDCNYEGKIVKANKELNPKKVKDWDLIWKLNEKGHIKPLTEKEFLEIKGSISKKERKDED